MFVNSGLGTPAPATSRHYLLRPSGRECPERAHRGGTDRAFEDLRQPLRRVAVDRRQKTLAVLYFGL